MSPDDCNDQTATRSSDDAEISGRNSLGDSNSSSRLVRAGSSRPDRFVGTVLEGRYRILEVVGKGGMGVVYKAIHERMDRVVAVKMLLPALIADETSLKRFEREAKAASRINHPNIIGLHDYGVTEDGDPYLVMDFLEGQSLADAIKKEGQLPVARVIHIFRQVCDALQQAHKSAVIHRDLKPGNIMLVTNDEDTDYVKVVDFGVAKLSSFSGEDAQRLTQTGEVFGSPVYMSPEQCHGENLDSRSDIYGLGIVLYETLTGKLPLVGRNVIETITKHMQCTPPPFSEVRPDLYIPERLEQVVFKALEKDPAARQQSMSELKDELITGVARSGKNPVQAKPAKKPLKQSSANKMPIALMAGAGGLLLMVAAAVLLWVFLKNQSPSQTEQKQIQSRQPQTQTQTQVIKPQAPHVTPVVGSRQTPPIQPPTKTATDNPPLPKTPAQKPVTSGTPQSEIEQPAVESTALASARDKAATARAKLMQAMKRLRKLQETGQLKLLRHHQQAVEQAYPEHLPSGKHHHAADPNQAYYDFTTRREGSYSKPAALPITPAGQ